MLNIELLNSPASILSLILEETVLCLPLDLIMGGAVDGYGGAVIGSVSGSVMSLTTFGAACACGCCRGSELVGTGLSLCAAS